MATLTSKKVANGNKSTKRKGVDPRQPMTAHQKVAEEYGAGGKCKPYAPHAGRK